MADTEVQGVKEQVSNVLSRVPLHLRDEVNQVFWNANKIGKLAEALDGFNDCLDAHAGKVDLADKIGVEVVDLRRRLRLGKPTGQRLEEELWRGIAGL